MGKALVIEESLKALRKEVNNMFSFKEFLVSVKDRIVTSTVGSFVINTVKKVGCYIWNKGNEMMSKAVRYISSEDGHFVPSKILKGIAVFGLAVLAGKKFFRTEVVANITPSSPIESAHTSAKKAKKEVDRKKKIEKMRLKLKPDNVIDAVKDSIDEDRASERELVEFSRIASDKNFYGSDGDDSADTDDSISICGAGAAAAERFNIVTKQCVAMKERRNK